MLPGAELIDKGIVDLEAGRETVESLLVSIGARRLREAGVPIPPETFTSPEHRLYEMLRIENPYTAHSKYNAFIRRLVSFERAAECVK